MHVPVKKTLSRAIGAAALVLTLLHAPDIQAHGGLSVEEDTCVLRLGPYKMHFVGYQPDSTKQEFCEDIPETGHTIIVLDYFDPALRRMTAEVRIIKDVGAPETGDLTPITVFDLPPALHPTGTFNFQYNFPQPEKFIGLVTIRDGQREYVSRFPFSVGMPTSNWSLTRYAAIFAGLVMALLLYFWYRRQHHPAKAAGPAGPSPDDGWVRDIPPPDPRRGPL